MDGCVWASDDYTMGLGWIQEMGEGMNDGGSRIASPSSAVSRHFWTASLPRPRARRVTEWTVKLAGCFGAEGDAGQLQPLLDTELPEEHDLRFS